MQPENSKNSRGSNDQKIQNDKEHRKSKTIKDPENPNNNEYFPLKKNINFCIRVYQERSLIFLVELFW